MLGRYDEMISEGYIFVFQDIRGRYASQGKFVMLHPVHDPATDPKGIDEATDTYDTIDWLIKNVAHNNGRVGMDGISYDGYLVTMGMINPHPALKAASEQACMGDTYLGDDFFHNGAFRLSYAFEYSALLETSSENYSFQFDRFDLYDWYLRLGPLSNANGKYFHDKIPSWNDFVAHPSYDDFWKRHAVAYGLKEPTVPNLNVAGWWDQEDFYGPLKTYELLERHDRNDQNFLVVGPWNHGGWQAGPGDRLGKIAFDSDTGKYFRAKVQAPFFARYLKDRGEKPPEALLFQTGCNQWVPHKHWPPKSDEEPALPVDSCPLHRVPVHDPGHGLRAGNEEEQVDARPVQDDRLRRLDDRGLLHRRHGAGDRAHDQPAAREARSARLQRRSRSADLRARAHRRL